MSQSGDPSTAASRTAGARLATIFGGSGFVGRHTVRMLASQGWRVRIACRRPDLAHHLQPLGRVGQIHAVQANVRDPDSVGAALRGSTAVINLVGILTEKSSQKFHAVQTAGAENVARAAAAAGAPILAHVSAIGANLDSASLYARSKAEAEAAVLAAFPAARIIRPSIIFGPEDSFFNRFAAIARISPIMPLFGGGKTLFQPVYVGDVAAALARICDGGGQAGVSYELGGPQVCSFEDLLRYICRIIGRRRFFAPMPWALCSAQALALELVSKLSLGLWPDWLLVTRDQVKLLQSDNIVSAEALADHRTLAALGVQAQPIDAHVPLYLYRFRKSGQFEREGT